MGSSVEVSAAETDHEPSTVLTRDQIDHFHGQGFLVLRGLLAPGLIAEALNELDEIASGRFAHSDAISIDVLHGAEAGQRLSLPQATGDTFSGPVKINDLHRHSDTMRACCQDPALLSATQQLLQGEPLICNSLNFIYGSEQPPHFDTWFMPPPVPNKMIVASICLDPTTRENGPLVYYPRSHCISPYRFSHSGIDIRPDEMDACNAFLQRELFGRGIGPAYFDDGEPGDVFLWHAQMLHGGAQIADPSKTRRSLVAHYWRKQDVPPDRVAALATFGAAN